MPDPAYQPLLDLQTSLPDTLASLLADLVTPVFGLALAVILAVLAMRLIRRSL